MSLTAPIVTDMTQSMARSIVGGVGGANPLVFHAITPDPLTFEIKGVLRGVGDLTEARTGSIYQPDHEQIWREFKTTIAAYFGGRVVENLAKWSEDFSNGVWSVTKGTKTTGISDPNGGSTAGTFTSTDANGFIRQNLSDDIPSGNRGVISFWLKRRAGSGDVKIQSPAGTLTTVPVTSEWARFVSTSTASSGTTLALVWLSVSGDAVDIAFAQVEDTEGRTDTTTPSEYIPTTTAPVQRVYGNELGNSVASNVVTEAVGSELASPVWLVGQKSLLNSQIRSFNLADAEWTKSNMTAVLNATGMRGDANGATTLTATAANATCIANAITDASDDQTTRWHIKRLTGTGTINISVDGGSTWQDVTTEVDSTAGFNEALEDQAALANPQIGIRVVTDTDAVIVGNAEAHLGDLKEAVRQSGPLFTVASTISTNATDLSFDDANHADISGLWFCEFRNAGLNAANLGGLIGMGSGGRIGYTSDALRFKSATSGGIANGPAITLAADDTEYKYGMAYGDSLYRVRTDSAWGTAVGYDGEINNTENKINVVSHQQTTDVGTNATMLIRDIQRCQLSYTAAQAKAEELSP